MSLPRVWNICSWHTTKAKARSSHPKSVPSPVTRHHKFGAGNFGQLISVNPCSPVGHQGVCQKALIEVDLEMHTVHQSGWLFHPRPQRYCSAADERPKLHANIRSPCGQEPQASLRLAVRDHLQPCCPIPALKLSMAFITINSAGDDFATEHEAVTQFHSQQLQESTSSIISSRRNLGGASRMPR